MMQDKSLSPAIDNDMLARAEAAVAALRDAYRDQLASDVEQLMRLWAAHEAGMAAGEFIRRVHAIAHDIKGQGGSFGYDLATDIGASLSAHTEEGADRSSRAFSIMHLHFRMLRAVSMRNLAGDGGETGDRFRAKLAKLSV